MEGEADLTRRRRRREGEEEEKERLKRGVMGEWREEEEGEKGSPPLLFPFFKGTHRVGIRGGRKELRVVVQCAALLCQSFSLSLQRPPFCKGGEGHRGGRKQEHTLFNDLRRKLAKRSKLVNLNDFFALFIKRNIRFDF